MRPQPLQPVPTATSRPRTRQNHLEPRFTQTNVESVGEFIAIEVKKMLSRFSLSLIAAVALLTACPSVQAQDPFGVQFGYVLGYQNSFRNRLPTPPYFSIYPPVYYGKRYERPYGESPFASPPLLGASNDYHAVPRGATYRSRSVIMNPYIDAGPHVQGIEKFKISEPVAVAVPRVGKTVEILNPYATELYAKK